MVVSSDRAEAGVGMIITFVAVVMVAVVASGVLVSATGELQRRAAETGFAAAQEVVGTLRAVSVYGQRNTTESDIYDINLYVEAQPGAAPVDLSRLLLRYSDASSSRHYPYGSGDLGVGLAGEPQAWFEATWIRGDATGTALLPGALVELHFNLYDRDLAPRESAAIHLLPETGGAIHVELRSYSTFADETSLMLV